MKHAATAMLLMLSTQSLVTGQAFAQEKMAYQNRNQIDYGPLVVRSVRGRVTDREGVPIPMVDVGVFTEREQTLDRFPGRGLVERAPGLYRAPTTLRGNE
jgi:hypothetical protein